MKFKNADVASEYPRLRERMKIILRDAEDYLRGYGHELYITDILSDALEDKKLKRVSRTHREGRAVDVRCHAFSKDFIIKMIEHFNLKYETWAAISRNSGMPNLIVWHDNGNGQHLHFQIRPYED